MTESLIVDTALEFSIFLVILFYGLYKTVTVFKEKEPEPDQDKNLDDHPGRILNMKDGEEALDFLNRIIQEKYNYHLYLTLMPIYLDRKVPEKNVVRDLKEKIYVSVVGSLTHATKKEILRFFTEKGIEIYVHERIIILMNETDFRTTEKFTEAFRDLTPKNMDRILG